MASTITLIWNEALPATVTLSGSSGAPATSFEVAGSPVTFPYSLTATTTFSTTEIDRFSLSVVAQGQEIAGKPDGVVIVPITEDKQGVILAPGPDAFFPDLGFKSAAGGSQISFYTATPVSRAAAPTAATAAAPAGGAGATAGAYDTAANRDTAIALINNTRTRVIEIEAALRNLGLIS